MEQTPEENRRKGLIACKECCRVEDPQYQYIKNESGSFMYSHDTITLCDEYRDSGGAVFGCAPCVRFFGDKVGIGAGAVSDARAYYGSASGFPASNLESGNLDASCTPLNLDLAIKICKDNGLKVIRIKTIEEEL